MSHLSPSASPKRLQAADPRLAALMQNILVDDDIDLAARCPENPWPAFSAGELEGCYRLAWQLLESGVSMDATRGLVAEITWHGTATAGQAARFKLIRARFKHMRFICATCTEQHQYPGRLDRITRLMGNFQDAFKNGRRIRTLWRGFKLCLQLQGYFFGQLRASIVSAPMSGLDSFRQFLEQENRYLAENVQPGTRLTARKFHGLRKIISRRVALNDTRRVLCPSAHLDAISCYLATINGLMGNLHDELVLRQMQGELDYEHQLFDLPEEIASRIRVFIGLLQAPASGSGQVQPRRAAAG